MVLIKVQRKMCTTCIYRRTSPLNLAKLEAEVKDRYGSFKGFRLCHHTHKRDQVCCAGFWRRHRNQFQLGQIAQRLRGVLFVTIDRLQRGGERHEH
jgi:hypothetical protein